MKQIEGFTIIEMMVTVVILSILAVIAVPAYQTYITKTHAKAAAGDLAALALVMENGYQRTLQYTASTTTTTTQTIAYVASSTTTQPWSPSQSNYFTYTLTAASSSYSLTATGISSTGNSGCIITQTSSQPVSSNGAAGCGGY